MAFISRTKEIIDDYYRENSNKSDAKARMIADRKELYEYEEKIQTQLGDMTAEQIIDLMRYLYDTGLEEATLHLIFQKYKAFVRQYLQTIRKENGPAKWNPFDEPGMAWPKASKRILDDAMILTSEDLKNVSHAILTDSSLERGKALIYITILILTYKGIPTSDKLLSLKTSDVNLKTGVVLSDCRTFKLDDDALHILREMDKIAGKAAEYQCDYLRYQDSFICLPIREYKSSEFQFEKWDVVTPKISRIFSYINRYSNKKISARKVYMVGLYDYFVEKFGIETTNELLTSYKDDSDVAIVKSVFAEYGFSYVNVSKSRKELSRYKR